MTPTPNVQVQQLNPLDFPLYGSRLIEASAGTGKTFTIALLYVRLVLGQGLNQQGYKKPLLPREILVVTFTELAAGELRDRIRARLVETAEYFQNKQLAEDDLLVQLRSDYPQDSWAQCAWRLQTASESIDEASISTIHSWCNRMLVEHAFDSRGLFDRSLETDTSELLNEVVEDYWRSHFYQLDSYQAGLISKLFASPAELLKKVRSLLNPGIQGVSYCGLPLTAQPADELLEQLAANNSELQAAIQAIRTHWLANWDEISSHLVELRDGLKSVTKKDRDPEAFNQILDNIHHWLQEGGSFPKYLASFAHGSFDFLKTAKIKEAKDLEAFALTRQYNLIKSQAAEQQDDLLPNLLSQSAHWIARQYQLRKNRQSCMTQDDLISELAKALDSQVNGDHALALAASIRKGFPVAMIDEFQDTDPLQYQIFDRIYQVKDNHSDLGLFMIGDPKQSIYAFRGADINSYLDVRADTQGRHYTLKRNFRSTHGVVAACNAFFQYAEQHERGAFQYRNGQEDPIPFVEVEANGRDRQLFLGNSLARSLSFWHFDLDPETAEDVQGVSLKDYIERAAQQTASQIARWLSDAAKGKAGFGKDQVETALEAKDIAIIVRDKTEAKAVTQALERRNIRSVYLSDRESLFASQEAKDCLHWLQACAEPTDERLVKTAVGSVSMQIPVRQLADWLDDELQWEAIMLDFAQLQHTWRKQGVMVMLRRLMERFLVPQRLMQGQNERGLTNLLHLAEWLQEASGQLDGEQALIRHLAEQLDNHSEENLLRLESDAQRIRILTIHKSKGLEFPLVVLPSIGSWKPIDGHKKQVPWRIGEQHYVEVAGNKSFAEGWDTANRERIKEDLRLLYVAMTRASFALFLGTGPLLRGSSKKIQLQDSALGYILNGGKDFKDADEVRQALEQLAQRCGTEPLIDPQPEPATTQAPNPQQPELDPPLPVPQLGNLYNWWIASYSALEFAGQELPAPAIEPESARQDQLLEYRPEAEAESETANAKAAPSTEHSFMHNFPRGAQWGTFLHGLLEWAALAQGTGAHSQLQGFAAAVADKEQRDNLILRRCRLRGIQDLAQGLSDWLHDFIVASWPTGFALQDISPNKLSVEMEFLLEIHQAKAQDIDRLIRSHMQVPDSVASAKPSTLNGMLKGFIDLVVEHNGQYYIIDWKSNHLGDSDADYSPERMQKAIYEHRYDVQYILYSLALHRHLRQRLPGYDYDQHMGGALYSFIRGWNNPDSQGLFSSKPPKALIEALDQLCSKATQGAQP